MVSLNLSLVPEMFSLAKVATQVLVPQVQETDPDGIEDGLKVTGVPVTSSQKTN
jgi:hypothetical protein